jgi:hypothetical protein
MSDPVTPARSNFWISASAVVGVIVIFALILLVAYLPQAPAPLADGAKTPEQRKNILVEHRAKETKAATGYAWIDQSKGVVQLPIDRAMQLTIQELNAKK